MSQTLINKWEKEILDLQAEIDSHPFHWSPGFRWKESSNFKYRKTREHEIKELRKKLKEEKERKRLIDHQKQNQELENLGLEAVSEKKKGWDAFVGGLDDVASLMSKPARDLIGAASDAGRPVFDRVADSFDNTVNKTSDVLSSPIIWIAGGAVAFLVVPKLLK